MRRKKINMILKEKKEREVERHGDLKNLSEILTSNPFQKPITITDLFWG